MQSTAAANLDAEIAQCIERLAAQDFEGPVSRLRVTCPMARAQSSPPPRPFLRAAMERMLNRQFHTSREHWVAAFGISAVATAITMPIAAHVNVWAGASTAVLCFVPLCWIAPRMPEILRGARQRRPVLSVAWLVLVLLAVVQMARWSQS